MGTVGMSGTQGTYSYPERQPNQQMVLLLALIGAVQQQSVSASIDASLGPEAFDPLLQRGEDFRAGWNSALYKLEQLLTDAARKERW